MKKRPNDKELYLYDMGSIQSFSPYRFLVVYPDYDPCEGGGFIDCSEPLGFCLTPPVLPSPCSWEMKI